MKKTTNKKVKSSKVKVKKEKTRLPHEEINDQIMHQLSGVVYGETKAGKTQREVLNILDIPYSFVDSKIGDIILAENLYKILMDETKCKELISKLSNKMLW